MGALALSASIARLHIVAIGALGVLTFGFAFTGARPWLVAGLAALDWFVVNLLNRVVDLREDIANGITGADVVARHRRLALAVGVAVLVASLVATALLAPLLLVPRIAFHALGFAYNWPLAGRRRIKQRYFWKNLASATGFLLTCFALPLLAAPSVLVSSETIGATALFFLLFELSYEVLYDLRDVEGDRLADVKSYPVVHGVEVGWRIAWGLMLCSSVVAFGAFALGLVPWRIAIMGTAPLIQLGWSARVRRRGITSRDCIGVTWIGVALLAGWHVWEALGLPGA
ncbi:MAG: hypothetical protein A2138_16940 [Deltaproteobacteria bacterium RBG_16_71_12]|nr:MAG: hypothetical protein A2138_16940 [Deltaproteobacteria bacterium RBG_16_71_12]